MRSQYTTVESLQSHDKIFQVELSNLNINLLAPGGGKELYFTDKAGPSVD